MNNDSIFSVPGPLSGKSKRIRVIVTSLGLLSLTLGSCDQSFRTFIGHARTVNVVVFSQDGKLLASGSNDATVKVWRVSDGSLLRTLKTDLPAHNEPIQALAFAPSQTRLDNRITEITAQFWQVPEGSSYKILYADGGMVSSVAFSPDGGTLVRGTQSGTELWWLSDSTSLRFPGPGLINSVAFSHDGSMFVSGSSSGKITLIHVPGNEEHIFDGHNAAVNSIAFSPDGGLLASGSSDKTIKVWRTADGLLLRTLAGHSDSVRSVTFSPDGGLLASGSDDGTIKIWLASDDQLIRTIGGNSGGVLSVAFSPDGSLLAFGAADGSVKLWHVLLDHWTAVPTLVPSPTNTPLPTSPPIRNPTATPVPIRLDLIGYSLGWAWQKLEKLGFVLDSNTGTEGNRELKGHYGYTDYYETRIDLIERQYNLVFVAYHNNADVDAKLKLRAPAGDEIIKAVLGDQITDDELDQWNAEILHGYGKNVLCLRGFAITSKFSLELNEYSLYIAINHYAVPGLESLIINCP